MWSSCGGGFNHRRRDDDIHEAILKRRQQLTRRQVDTDPARLFEQTTKPDLHRWPMHRPRSGVSARRHRANRGGTTSSEVGLGSLQAGFEWGVHRPQSAPVHAFSSDSGPMGPADSSGLAKVGPAPFKPASTPHSVLSSPNFPLRWNAQRDTRGDAWTGAPRPAMGLSGRGGLRGRRSLASMGERSRNRNSLSRLR